MDEKLIYTCIIGFILFVVQFVSIVAKLQKYVKDQISDYDKNEEKMRVIRAKQHEERFVNNRSEIETLKNKNLADEVTINDLKSDMKLANAAIKRLEGK